MKGADKLTLYQFNTGAAKHYFCSACGIYTHHQRRSNPNELGVNVACLDGVSPFDFPEVTVYDAVHHPSDRPDGASGIAGTLIVSKEFATSLGWSGLSRLVDHRYAGSSPQ